MTSEPYRIIVSHYEQCLEKHGDCHRGVDWPNQADADTRYRVMLQLIPAGERCSLLDFGCGAGQLYSFLRAQGEAYHGVEYAGLDMSPQFIRLCREKFPQLRFLQADILQQAELVPECDYIVLNGVFTEKLTLSFDEMEGFFQRMLCAVFAKARKGIAFNVMSKAVDWERDDLFHLSTDRLISFLAANLSRHFVIRNDYGLYEYTTYVYRAPGLLGAPCKR